MKAKQIFSIFLVSIFMFTLTACGNQANANQFPDETNQIAKNDSDEDNHLEKSTESSVNQEDKSMEKTDNNILIVYFSETGNTDKLANIIHEQINSDMFRIEPVTPYPKGDEVFDYTKKEQDNDERPEIAGSVDKMEQYDVVFIGYPIWWYEVPQIIKTFLDEYDLSGKTIVPFNTHEGSRDGGTYRYIGEQEPDAIILEGLPIRGGDMSNDQIETVRTWLVGLGVI